ncbi:MAG: efflux RND transporter permease subunit, partial [Deltaproteobacteria bacterium]|nr:efflux RND transporter permease subunit [Deltaproteobacteria bacterium]
MWLTRFALEHRTTVLVFAFLLLISGGVAYLTLPREAAPDIKIPIIMVVVPYPGVGPEDIESLLTTPLEAELKDVDDLDVLNSTSAEGMSMIQVNFLPDADLSEALTSVRDKVNRVRPELPADIQEPVINEISSSDWPVLMVSISGEAGLVKLKRLAEELEQEIEAMDGVLEVDVFGGTEREIRVEVNPHLLTSYDLSLTDVTTALSQENVNVPGGPVEEGDLRYTLRIPEELKDPREIEDMVVSTRFGHPVRIREVATVVDDFKEITTVSRYRGTEGVSLTLKKQSGANIIKLVDSVKEFIDSRSSTFPAGTRVVYLNDYSKFIRERVDELENNILTALLLVVAVLFLFIGGRNAMFVAVAIPLSMLMAFVILQMMGVTLNMVVLFGLILALGMLVDNAIVIVENSYRHTQLGKSIYQAAFDAAREVAWPVITSTLTTLAVFFPLLSWPGIMGKFFGYLPLTLIVTLSSSLFVALVFNPVFCATFMKPGAAASEEAGGVKTSFLRGYRSALRWSLRHRAIVVVGMLLLFFGSFAAYITSHPRIEFFPATTPDRARVNIEAPEGTNLQATDRISASIERYLDGLDNVKHFMGNVGTGGSGHRSAASSEGTPYLASIAIDFLDRADWKENPLETIETTRAFTSLLPGAP